MKIGYQGAEGSYSHAAVVQQFGKSCGAQGYESFDDVFSALGENAVDQILVPVENSIIGTITRVLDLTRTSKASITLSVQAPIGHVLLGRPGSTLSDIRTVRSHPAALAQCHEYLHKNSMRPIAAYDTGGAAQELAAASDATQGVIASAMCASIYGLDILAEDVSTTAQNVTTFWLLSNEPQKEIATDATKTSLVFKTKHFPGALVSCLQRLSKQNINMTRLESRPIPENHGEYHFYVDFEGTAADDSVRLALEEFEACAEYMHVLGSYPCLTINDNV